MSNNNEEIEKEVQARVEFKIRQILTAVENTARAHQATAFLGGHPKYSYYAEALRQAIGIIKKEMKMATPVDQMHLQNMREKREKAIDEIVTLFDIRGKRDMHMIEKRLVDIIKSAQN